MALSSLELAAGWPGGLLDPPSVREFRLPIDVLCSQLRSALGEGRCAVLFSGGVDSSLLLCLAAQVARDCGAPPPIPVTRRFPGVTATDETAEQERLIGELGLSEWIVHEYHEGEADVIGPIAAPWVRRCGPVWPAPTYTFEREYRAVAGMVVLAGEGGDEVFGVRARRPLREVLRHPPRHRGEMRDVVLERAPRPVRARLALRSASVIPALPWVREPARTACRRALAAEFAAMPTDRPGAVRYLGRRRAIRLGLASMRDFAGQLGADLRFPLLDPGFLDAVARAITPGLARVDRATLVEHLFPGVVPAWLLQRRTKATFGEAYFSEASRSFAASWRGDGLDPAVFDADRLRRAWLEEPPTVRMMTVLQHAWAASC